MLKRCITLISLIALGAFPAAAQYHTADVTQDQSISLTELLRVIQFFNSGGFHCVTPPATSEDGFLPGSGADHSCAPHDSDYNPQNWQISLTELLRLIQFFNSGGYHTLCGSEDNFGPGTGILFDCGAEGEGASEGEGNAEGQSEGTIEGQPEGVVEGEGEGAVEGQPEGVIEGEGEGTVEGQPEGVIEGQPEGTVEGQPEGVIEGEGEGTVEGQPEGVVEGEGEGTIEGQPEGVIEGEGEGTVEGQPEGVIEGEGEGTVEGQPEGVIEGEGEGTVEGQPEGVVEGEGEGEVSVWYVREDGTGDGSSWENAYGTIQEAVDAAFAAGGGQVWVAAGTYGATSDPVITMQSGVALYAGFEGAETSLAGRDWQKNLTVIDGNLERRCAVGADNALIDGFTIENGYSTEGGGGMYNKNVSPAVAHCIFSDNHFGGKGTGKDIEAGSAMHNESCAPALTDCVFQNNDGYALYCNASAPGITDCVFTGNEYYSILAAASSAPVITRCQFRDNQDSAIYVDSSNVTVADCTFIGNAYGAIEASLTSLNVSNCLVIGNGAGLILTDSTVTVTNCTFTGNMGIALYCAGDAFSGIVANSIFWGDNSAGSEISQNGGALGLTHCCVQGDYAGTDNISGDPLLIGTPNSLGHIRPTSPCIDAGSSADAPAADIRGVARPQGSAADIGAYELDDSDGDGISDTWELDMFGDLTAADADSDADTDGLSDLLESLYNTDPFEMDTDHDGINDGDELTLGFDPTIQSGIRRVSLANTSGAEDGRSWETAFTAIQSAIDDIDEGEIWVAAGIYTGSSGDVVTAKYRVSLYGGFAGTETARESRDWNANQSIIDGESARRGVNCQGNIMIDGFTIRNGNADFGAGLLADLSPVTVSHCVFTGNYATLTGGGINAVYGAILSDCDFTENTAESGSGGGVTVSSGASSSVIRCDFSNNTASSGGGLVIGGNSATVSQCTFTGNTATMVEGGALVTNSSNGLTVSECDFTNNKAENSTGGAIGFLYANAGTLTQCAFTGNTAHSGGGAIYLVNGAADITRCIFAHNASDVDRGGGILNLFSSPAITNCLFFKNDAEYGGGGLCNSESSPTVTNCTFTQNSAMEGGAVQSSGSSMPVFTNCIFWADSASWYQEIANGGMASTFVNFSCIDGGYGGNNNITDNPKFAIPATDDYQLQSDSPCINAGTTEGAPAEDLLGVARPQGSNPDMGAYEAVLVK